MRRFISPALDLAVVGLFVVLGRQTHDESNGVAAITLTAAPFVLALLPAWLSVGFLRRSPWWVDGVVVALVTAGVGAFLRRTVFDEGIAFPFVLVTAGFLLIGMLGWRLVAHRSGVGRRDDSTKAVSSGR